MSSGTDPETIPEWDKDTTYPNTNTVVKKLFNGVYYYFQNHKAITTTYMPLTANGYYHTQALNSTYVSYPLILEEVGNGDSINDYGRSNARTLDLYGNEYLMGDLYTNCSGDGTNGTKVATEAYVNTRIPTPPVSDGTYNLQVTVASGIPTYSWVAATGSASGVSF